MMKNNIGKTEENAVTADADNEKEENILKYTTFLNMLKNFNIEDVENVEKEQNNLNREIPFKIKYQGNYLWQIYYSENTL